MYDVHVFIVIPLRNMYVCMEIECFVNERI